MTFSPLHHIVRVRTSDDLTYVRNGLMDEVIVNANQLENSAQSTAAVLWRNSLPLSIDPVLWRFQLPSWSSNKDGETKRNYKRLGTAYAKGTELTLGGNPLMEVIKTDSDWRSLAANVINYQRERLLEVSTQLELLAELRELTPSRLVAPALVAFSKTEDRSNRVMTDASIETAQAPVSAQLIIPFERLVDPSELSKIISGLPSDGVSSFFIWTPNLTEERLITDDDAFRRMANLVSSLAESGIPVGHQYANYTTFALNGAGLAAAVHHLGWTDSGDPVDIRGGGPRSCRTYVPGIRHCTTYSEAFELCQNLSDNEYKEFYCDCGFCAGAFDAGVHPHDLLLESQPVIVRGRERQMPTSRAVGANTWHFLLSRRMEIESFSKGEAVDVVRRDAERAADLRRDRDVARLQHLAERLPAA